MENLIVLVCLFIFLCLLGFVVFIIFKSMCKHNWCKWKEQEAICGKKRIQTRKCNICGKIQENDIGDIVQHTWGEWNTVNGTRQDIKTGNSVDFTVQGRQCSKCGLRETSSLF